MYFLFSFLPWYGTQQPRRGRPSNSNVFRRFAHRQSFNNLPKELALPSPNFYRGSESAKFGGIFNFAQLWGIGVWKCSKISQLWNKLVTRPWSPCVFAKFGEVRSTHPGEQFGQSAHLLELDGENVLTNNSAADCSISLKFYTEFGHMTPQVLQKFKVKGSKVKVTALHNVSASKIVTFHELIGWSNLTKFKLCANYPTA